MAAAPCPIRVLCLDDRLARRSQPGQLSPRQSRPARLEAPIGGSGSAGMTGATCDARSKRERRNRDERETHRYVVNASFGRSTGGRLAGNSLVLVTNSTAPISILTAALRVRGIDDLDGVDWDGLRHSFTSCAPVNVPCLTTVRPLRAASISTLPETGPGSAPLRTWTVAVRRVGNRPCQPYRASGTAARDSPPGPPVGWPTGNPDSGHRSPWSARPPGDIQEPTGVEDRPGARVCRRAGGER
jgi:hypothetical protein